MKLSEATSSSELFEDSLRALALYYPNSIVADLLTHFPAKVVMELIQIYSGQQICIPKVETVWKCYRNKVICDTLNVSNTRAERERLATFFRVSLRYVSVIYSSEKKKSPILSSRTAELIAKRVYRDKVRGAFKDIESILFGTSKGRKGSA